MSLRSRNAAQHAELSAEALVRRISNLRLRPERVEHIGADVAPDATRKRKARPRAHFGLPTDSSERLSLIAFWSVHVLHTQVTAVSDAVEP